MVFEPNFTRIASSARRNIGITQSVIELKLPTNEDSISAIYSVGAKSTIVSSEVVGNDITFSGLVDFQAIYDSDGISAVDYSAEFKDKYSTNSELRGEVIINSNIVDVSSSIVSGGIRVIAIVELTIDTIETKDLNVLTGVNCDNSYLSTKQISYNTYLGKASEKFDVSEDFELTRAKRVLMVTPDVCLTKVVPNENFVSIHGVLNVDICYQNGENTTDICSENKNFDFDYDVALSGIESESYIQSVISIVTNEIKVSTVVSDSGASISLYVPIVYKGYVFQKNNLEVVDDLYCMQNYLSITNEDFDSLCGYSACTIKDSISGSATISDTAPFIDDILGVCTNNIVLASSNVNDGRINIEGVANATVVYFTKELNAMTAVQIEMPFAVEEKVEGNNSSVVTLSLSNINARSKRGKEIEVSGDLCVYADMYSDTSNIIISNVNVGEEKPQDDCSLYLYVVRPNETLWDIAKQMSVSQDIILEQNPEVELPIKAGSKLVIYKSSLKNY